MDGIESEFQEILAGGADAATLNAYHDWLLDEGRAIDAAALLAGHGREIEKFDDLEGCLLADVKVSETEVVFLLAGGRRFRLYHQQDCCEYVRVEDVAGRLSDLCGHVLLMAEESSNRGDKADGVYGTETWTFYRLATVRGAVTIRWYGESNGYYSEKVDFEEVKGSGKG